MHPTAIPIALFLAFQANSIPSQEGPRRIRLFDLMDRAELSGLPRTAIHVIHNGIELEAFSRPELFERRPVLRRELGFLSADRPVLVPSVLREAKGHEVLIEAVPALKARVPRARVVLAGAGEREAALRRLACPYGDAVLFLGARRDIPELLAASDLVVLPSMAEGLPTALIEAAAAGRPVVATRVGGAPEVVKQGRTGILVPPNNPAALADAMATLLLDPERAQRLGQVARQLAKQRFSLELQVSRTMALWSDVIAAAKR